MLRPTKARPYPSNPESRSTLPHDEKELDDCSFQSLKKKKKKNFLKLSELDQINRVIGPKSRAGWGLSMIGRGLKQNCGDISSLRALSFYMPGENEARHMNPLALL